jgi:hypothetical protein
MAFVIRLGRRGHVHSRVAMESWRCYIGAVLAWDTLVGVSVGALRALAVPMLGLWLLAGGAARFYRFCRLNEAVLRSGVTWGHPRPMGSRVCASVILRRILFEVHKAAGLRGGCSGS